MKTMAAEHRSPDVLFMDPPRSGASEEFLHAVLRLLPKRIVYVSCGPDTLTRDLGILAKKHYHVSRIQPVDMFPLTGEAEVVTLLERKRL